MRHYTHIQTTLIASIVLTAGILVAQVSLVQTVVDGVNLLVEMEKRLEKKESIDDLMPAGCK